MDSAWEAAVRESLALHVDLMGYEFAASFIRSGERASASFDAAYLEQLSDAELGAEFREVAADGIRFVRIADSEVPDGS